MMHKRSVPKQRSDRFIASLGTPMQAKIEILQRFFSSNSENASVLLPTIVNSPSPIDAAPSLQTPPPFRPTIVRIQVLSPILAGTPAPTISTLRGTHSLRNLLECARINREDKKLNESAQRNAIMVYLWAVGRLSASFTYRL